MRHFNLTVVDRRGRVPGDDDDAACGLPEAVEYLARLMRVEQEELMEERGIFDGRQNV